MRFDVERNQQEIERVFFDGEELTDNGEAFVISKKQLLELNDRELPVLIPFELVDEVRNDKVIVTDSMKVVFLKNQFNQFQLSFSEHVYRKYWDGLYGLKPLMDFKKEIIEEHPCLELNHYEDDGTYISLEFATTLSRFSLKECLYYIEMMKHDLTKQSEDKVFEKILYKRNQ